MPFMLLNNREVAMIAFMEVLDIEDLHSLIRDRVGSTDVIQMSVADSEHLKVIEYFLFWHPENSVWLSLFFSEISNDSRVQLDSSLEIEAKRVLNFNQFHILTFGVLDFSCIEDRVAVLGLQVR